MLNAEAFAFLNSIAFVLASWFLMLLSYALWLTWRVYRSRRPERPS